MGKQVLMALAVFSVPLMVLAIDIDVTRARIVIADGKAGSVRTAAEELERHFALIGGRCPDGKGVTFVLGARPNGEPEPKPFESHVAIADGKVWLWGDDTWEHAEGWEDRQHPGTLFAVYVFLDEALGVKWPYPGDADTVLPKRRLFHLDNAWRGRYWPPLVMTQIRNYGALERKPDGRYGRHQARPDEPVPPSALRLTPADIDADARKYEQWLLRNRNYTRVRFHYGHAFVDWQERYLRDHPNWFGYYPGTDESRTDNGGRGVPDRIARFAKLCLSNPEVREKVIADWKERGMPDWHNICPNDGTAGFCHCADCLKLDARQADEPFLATLSDRYVWFWNRLLEQATKARPDVKFVTYIYSYYRLPTRRERIEFPDNLIAGTVPSIGDDIETYYAGWKERGLKHHFLRPNFLCYGMAFYRGNERLIYDAFRIARKYGSVGVDFDGGGGDYRQKDLESYVTARMIAYPEKSFETICDEFYSQFGAAAPAVREVRERIRAAGEDAVNRHIRGNKNIRSGAKRILDDSLLGQYAVLGNTEASLKANVETLKVARREKASGLTKVECRRLDDEIIRFEHSLLSFRFREAGMGRKVDQDALERAAKELYEFRVANKAALGHLFGGVYGLYGKRGGEHQIWARVKGVPR